MTVYQWVMLGLGALGFIGTWILGAFKLGRAVEQMRSALREDLDTETSNIFEKFDELNREFKEEQRIQDGHFGEVGAAMRQYIADVEKKVREVEIWGRDNYVLKGEFEKATDRLEDAIKHMAADIKTDFRNLSNKIDAKP